MYCAALMHIRHPLVEKMSPLAMLARLSPCPVNLGLGMRASWRSHVKSYYEPGEATSP